jgi:Glycosyl transferase family 2
VVTSATGDQASALELEADDSPHHPMAAWFADVRAWRRERYAKRPAPPGPRRRALITIVQNEPVFLPIWLGYYSRFFYPDDIYVLDHETTDGSTRGAGFVRIPVSRDSVDHTWMVQTIQELQHDLLRRYEMVLVTDVDEIVVPHPRAGTLGQYLDRFNEDWVNCLGYELLHMRDSEPPLALDRPILDQRGHWFYNDGYDKAALATVPMRWRPGFHGREDFHFNLDPDLRLVHLHRMDYDICLARHRVRSRRDWAPLDARERWAIHNRVTEDAEFEHWFYEDSCFPNLEIQPERISSAWRGLF